jgi:hypothetical protein
MKTEPPFMHRENSVDYCRIQYLSDARPKGMKIFLYRWKHGKHDGIEHIYCFTYDDFQKLLHHWNGYKEPINDDSQTWRYFEL